MKSLLLFCCLFITGLLVGTPANNKAGEDAGAELLVDRIMTVSDSLVKARLAALDPTWIEHRHDKIVRRRIVNYVQNWPIATGRMLARSARYFPIFEEQLAAAGMPRELKYLAIQESALRPYATSRVGAGGLWQLMPGTARELGLTVNDELDERLDAELGCAAGLQYLRYQYERYGDWALAMAAYNCGPGNVNKAIRRSGRRDPDYWQIRKFLPRETANYLPSIIAAVYLLTYYHEHDVAVEAMDLDMQITEAITVYRDLSLHRVAQVTGMRIDDVVELNPQYLKGYLPGLRGGHRLRLPSRVMPAMQAYLQKVPAGVEECDAPIPWGSPLLSDAELNPDQFYLPYRTMAMSGDTSLRQAAATFQVPVDQLAIWSNLGVLDSVRTDDVLTFYRIDEYRPVDPRVRDTPAPAPALANLPVAPITIPVRVERLEGELEVRETKLPESSNSVGAWLKGLFR